MSEPKTSHPDEAGEILCVEDSTYQHDMLGYREDRFLTKSGWKHTCSTPGSVWLWERKLPDGRVVLVNKHTALSMQQLFDFEREANEEDDGSEGD